MPVKEDFEAVEGGERVAIYAVALAVALLAGAASLGWEPARILAGHGGTWVPNLLFTGLAVAALAFAAIVRMSWRATAALQRARRIERTSANDDLTGLIGRAAFYNAIDARLNSPGGITPFILVLIDLDRFKEINDGHGHPAGDTVLVAAARRLLAYWGPEAVVARLGGDEFGVILDQSADDREVVAAAARFISELDASKNPWANRA